MRRWLALALAGLMLGVPAAPAASAATWERTGYDPGRTGAIPFEGPQTNDTAFSVQLPGAVVQEISIRGGKAYVITFDVSDVFEGNTSDLDQTALWTVDLDTAAVEKVLDFPDGASPRSVIGNQVVYQDGEDLVAAELPSGEEAWRTRVLDDEGDVNDRVYSEVLEVGDTLYIGFRAEEGGVEESRTGVAHTPSLGGVAAFDLQEENVTWEWRRIADPANDPDDRIDPETDVDPDDGSPDANRLSTLGVRLSADDRRVYAYTWVLSSYGAPGYYEYRSQYEVWAVEEGDGTLLGNDTEQEEEEWVYAPGAGPARQLSDAPGAICCAHPVVTTRAAHIRLDAFAALNKAEGNQAPIWTSPAGQTDQVDNQGSTGMGIRGDAFVGTSEQTVYRLDARTGDLVWSKTDPREGKLNTNDPVVIDEDTAYVPTSMDPPGDEFRGPGFEARDLETGERVWRWQHVPDVYREQGTVITAEAAFAPGVAVMGAKDGTLHVIGETEASLGEPRVETSTTYPDPGENVTVDVADTQPGAFGPATKYRVFWGDGTSTGWTDDTTFSHAYEEAGNATLRVQAANANQTSSTTTTVHVGQSEPVEPNAIEEAFHKENQDMTFGILGVAMALGGGAIGVARRKRKQSLLQDELDALERGFEETREQPSECEALLDNRKARARSLALDGKLDEEQVSIVETRAEELRAELRVDALEDRFGFLPYSLVTKARQMVEDGTVTALERDAFLQAVDEDEILTSQQKARVRERIESWFARDAGGG